MVVLSGDFYMKRELQFVSYLFLKRDSFKKPIKLIVLEFEQ